VADRAPEDVLPDTAEAVPGAHTAGAGPTSAGIRAAGPAGAIPLGIGPAGADPQAELLNRLRRTPGLEALVAEAVATWRAREGTPDDATPGWRAFSDAFPTFWEFSNRPR
jgi:hypothetical protein